MMSIQAPKISFLASILFAVSVVGGCTTIPDLDSVEARDIGGPTVKQITDRISCEVQNAVAKHRPDFARKTWAAEAQLSLQVEDKVSATPTLSFIEPAEFSFGVGGELSSARQRTYTHTIKYEVPKLTGTEQTCSGRRYLSGDLGIVEMVDTAFGTGTGDISKSFGQTIQFVVVRNLSGVGPTWTLSHLKGPGGLLGVGRKVTQVLTISFAPAEPKEKRLAGEAAASSAANAAAQQNLNMILQSIDLNR